MKRWLFLIALGLIGGLACRAFLFEGVYIATPSMEPNCPVGTHYFVNKTAYLFSDPERGDIIAFHSPVNEEKGLVKRVIGLPGETLSIKDKVVFINGRQLSEPYAVFKRKDEILVGDNIADIKIPEDSYFVTGDNRDYSGDSRDWKDPKTGEHSYFVTKDMIQGKVLVGP